ncbi:MAG: iron ABC transporter permease [Maricaulaceae bacterium]
MSRTSILIIGLCAANIIALILACGLGTTPMEPSRIISALIGQGLPSDEIIIWTIRMPRALAASLTGLALGASGAALQGLLRNPLAEPGILGVSATGSLFASVSIYYGLAALSPWVIPSAAILGAVTATAIIALAALKTRSVVTLILIGVGLSSFAGALMSLLVNFAPNPFTLSDIMNWMLGSVANRSFADILFVLPFMIAGLLIIWSIRRGLSALTLGEDTAHSLGLDLKKIRWLTVLGAGLATGASIALAGAIGFVGIVAPHMIRPFVHHDPARTILPSALLGSVMLVLADMGVRLLPTQTELKLGVVAAIIGAPAFIWIAVQRSNGGRGA